MVVEISWRRLVEGVSRQHPSFWLDGLGYLSSRFFPLDAGFQYH